MINFVNLKRTSRTFQKRPDTTIGQWVCCRRRGRWFKETSISDTAEIATVCNHLMAQWIDPVPSMEGNTNGILMVIGTEANHWLQPHGGWCWHFHPISTAYRHQRKRNFETCLQGEKNREEKPESQSPFLINRRAAAEILHQHTPRQTTLRHTRQPHTLWWTGTHINISAAQKLHFLPSFTSCILNIIFQRKSLNVSSLLATERSYLDYRLQAITKNWILSLIAVLCSESAKKPKDVNEDIMMMRNDTCGRHFSHVVKSLN